MDFRTSRKEDPLSGFCAVRIPNGEVKREFMAIIAQYTQIEDTCYDTDLSGEILLMGIAYQIKDCVIATKTIRR